MIFGENLFEVDLISIILIAIGLSMDSFAVSIVNGLMMPRLRFVRALGIALVLAVFQAAMPWLGWFAGSIIEAQIKSVDHWLAFILLSLIGLKMIYDSRKEEKVKKIESLKFSTLIGQSIATSIDALAVGVSFAFLEIDIYQSIVIIGVVTFLFAMIGLKLGKSIGHHTKNRIEAFGGILLILIGLKILIEHLFWH